MIDQQDKSDDELSDQNFDFLEEDDHTADDNMQKLNNSTDTKINTALYKKIATGITVSIALAVVGWFIAKQQDLGNNTLKLIPAQTSPNTTKEDATDNKVHNSSNSLTTHNNLIAPNKASENKEPAIVITNKATTHENVENGADHLNGIQPVNIINKSESNNIVITETKQPQHQTNNNVTASPSNTNDLQVDRIPMNPVNTDQNILHNNDPSNVASNQTPHVAGFDFKPNQTTIIQTHKANQEYAQQQEQLVQINKTITKLSQEMITNAEQINELQNQMLELSKFIAGINNTIAKLDSKFLNLTTTINAMYSDIQNVKKYIQEEDVNLNTNLKPTDKDLFSHSPEYIIHAVIPGRAWLKSSTGQIITVAEGDQIGDYGRIAVIDPNNNIVRTSSGVIFR